jgi:hypothetical protein
MRTNAVLLISGIFLSFISSAQAFNLEQKWKCNPTQDLKGHITKEGPYYGLRCQIVTDRDNRHAEQACAVIISSGSGSKARHRKLEKIVQFALTEGKSMYTFLDEGRVSVNFSHYTHPFWHKATIFGPDRRVHCVFPDPALLNNDLPGQVMSHEDT